MNLSFYNSFLNNLANQESQISTLQQQISTGSTVQTAAQNPAAYETASLANDQINQLTDDSVTQGNIQVQLGTASGVYSSVSSLLDNVQSIVEQGLNATSNSQNLSSLAQQVQSSTQQLMSLGNTQLPNGNYLFGGTRGNIQPFQTDSTGNISYFGDSGQSQASIDGGTLANTLVNGSALTTALTGDGTSVVTASKGNDGTGQIQQAGLNNVQQASAFQAGSNQIQITFSNDASGNLTYTATQVPGSFSTVNGQPTFTPTPGGTTTTLAQGPVNTSANGETDLNLLGMNFQITGSPDATDRFNINPARPQTAFSLLQQISSTLNGARATPAQAAQTNQALNQSLAELGQYQQSITTAQAQNGVTLQALSNAKTNVGVQQSAAQTTIDNATAVNMPAAITALNQSMTAIEASMKAFSEVQSLSLFKYL